MVKPFAVVCGAPGTGKSTETFKAFQNAYAILSSANNAHYYATLLKKGKLDGTRFRPPKKTKLISKEATGASAEYQWLKVGDAKSTFARAEPQVDGTSILIPDPTGDKILPVPQRQELEKILLTLKAKCIAAVSKGEAPPYDNLIIDEFGEMLDRGHSEIIPESVTKKGDIDTRAAYGTTGEWSDMIVDWARELISCNVGVCLVMHDREPEGVKKGGPRGPSANIGRKICAKADIVIQRYMKDPPPGAKDDKGVLLKPQYLWNAQASEQWERKCRGLDPEDMDRIGPMELFDIIKLSGYDM
jgi:hypothetical protein